MIPETLTRDGEPLTRSLSVRASADQENAREFTGIGVPFGERIEVADWFGRHSEEFEPGSVEIAEAGAHVYWRHGEVIGRVTESRDTDAGYEVTGRISDTALGRDAYTMLRDGTIDRLSIGFHPLEWREDEDGHITYTRVRAVEFSLVPNPAYPSAAVTGVRHNNPTAPQQTRKDTPVEPDTLTRDDLAPLNDSLAELQRGLALVQQNTAGPAGTVVDTLARFGSIGGLVRALASGNDEAANAYNTFRREFDGGVDGGVLADSIVKDSWLGTFIKLVTERRRVIAAFGGPAALPADGMNVEFGKLKSDTTQVGKQAAEADNLPFGKIELTTATAPVATYGGWSALSRQVIERSSVNYLDTLFQAMAIKYAAATEASFRATYTALRTARAALTGPGDNFTIPSDFTADDVLDLVVDLGETFDDRGYSLTGLHVSKDVFKALAHLKDGDNRLMSVWGPATNQVGQLNLAGLSGAITSLNVSVLPGAAAGTMSAYDPVALRYWENPGAPLQLQDENIVNLTKDFSLYGYAASGALFEDAVVPVKLGTTTGGGTEG